MLSRNTVKYIQSLNHKKFRDIHKSFIAETPKVVSEFLDSNYQPEQIYATSEWIASIEQNMDTTSLPIHQINDPELARISQLKTPHDVVAIFRIPEEDIPSNISGKISIALDNLQDPGNLGTIIRIADWFGVENIFCSTQTANAYNPKVVQATMGSLAHVKIHYLDLERFLNTTSQTIIAATLHGNSLYNTPPINEGILLIGNEAAGINDILMNTATMRLTIPRSGKAESLNAAVATAIFLSHITSPK